MYIIFLMRYRYAFVKFAKQQDGMRALAQADGHVLNGVKLSVAAAAPMPVNLKTFTPKSSATTKYPHPSEGFIVEEKDGLYPIHISNYPQKFSQVVYVY